MTYVSISSIYFLSQNHLRIFTEGKVSEAEKKEEGERCSVKSSESVGRVEDCAILISCNFNPHTV